MNSHEPRKSSDSDKVSIESLLREKLKILFSSMQCRDADSFDESTDTIEMLMSYDTKAFKDLTSYQQKLKQALKERMQKIRAKAANCQTSISKRNYIKINQYDYEWRYRKDYLFKIIYIFISRNILESEKPSSVKIEKVIESQQNA